ncbi:MAG: reverse transcriptase domain-containing protein [Candidatus Kaiserbacteria bacterium]|nr:reverse transcriptase domain-containing protein [Candidatus Kaiserbacteria bacterium]
MQTAETVLSVIQKRGAEGKTLERLFRQLFNEKMYMKAYSEIYANKGALTPGMGEDTLDGMSREKIDRIIQKIKKETYRWQPVRRTYIPKENGGERPLGIPSGNDKLLQATMKILLEAYYEPTFSKRSHGFRSGKGCHTALMQITQSHRNVSWFIEGDIKGFFDNVDHEILLEIMATKIEDQRFLRLVKYLLKAGYFEDWKWNATYSGTPQGGVISPLLANIYLDVFDKWVEEELMPLYNRGREEQGGRKRNPEYRKYEHARSKAKQKGDVEAYKKYGKLMKSVPTVIEDDSYRKLEYVRYADDFLLSFAGPKKEAEEIRESVRNFLEKELLLELSLEKTLITHARSEKAKFLGYELCVMQSNERRRANGQIWYGIPKEVIKDAVRKYSRNGKPIHRPEWLANNEYDIVASYQAEYRGLVQYYIMAHNVHLLTKVKWFAESSLLKTLAGKHKTSVRKMAKKHRATRKIEGKTYKVLEATVSRRNKKPLTAHFGAIPLKRRIMPSTIHDNIQKRNTNRSEIIDRMLREECEMCGEKGFVEVHHVRKLKDINKPGRKEKPAWMRRMIAIRRKTLMACKDCHRAITDGKHRKEWDIWKESLESRVQ